MTQPSLDDLIPHRSPMRFVEGVVGEVDGAFDCHGRVPAVLGQSGRVSPFLGIELAAQAAALYEAWRGSGEAAADIEPRVGYLVRLDEVRFDEPSLPADRSLKVKVKPAGSLHPFARYEVSVSELTGRRRYLSARISTCLVARESP